MELEDSHPKLNLTIRRAQANQFRFAANKHLTTQKNLFRRRKLKRAANKEFDKMKVANFGNIAFEDLMKDLQLEDIKAALTFAEKLEANEEINAKIEDLKKKQCKTDRCKDWVYFHARS